MNRTTMAASGLILLMLGASAVRAQPADQRPASPVKTPGLALAVEAAQTAIATCQAKGFRTAAIVANAAGTPVATLAADGTSARLQQVVGTKVATVARYKAPSGEIVRRAAADPALAAELQADPAIGVARAGGLLSSK